MNSKQQEILKIILNTIFEYYPTWQNEYEYDDEEKEILMSNILSSSELKSLLYPEKIFTIDVENEGLPYIGVQFKCK